MTKKSYKLRTSFSEKDKLDILSRYPGKDDNTIEVIFLIESKVGKNKFDFTESFYTGKYEKIKAYCNLHKSYFEFLKGDVIRNKGNLMLCPQCRKLHQSLSKIKKWKDSK